MPFSNIYQRKAILGVSIKQYLPADLCSEDVDLAANRMPAYWRRLQESAEQKSLLILYVLS